MANQELQSAVLKPLEMAQLCVSRVVRASDTLIDATLGNGHDALFLASLVPEGRVIGFDIQLAAVEKSSTKLSDAGYTNVEFYHVGHERISEYVQTEIGVCMFNLGYLPSTDKSIISKAETTLSALKQAMSLLRISGLISVMCYPGHEGGDQEAEAVKGYVASLDRRNWRCVLYQFANAPNQPAFLILMEKLQTCDMSLIV